MEFFDIVLGCSFGDEGKGKVVYDLLTKNKYDLCVRFNGGCNAGHTVYIDENKYVLHQLPIGVLFPTVYNLISSDTVIDIAKLRTEIRYLNDKGISINGRLFVSKACHIITEEAINFDTQNNLVGAINIGIPLKKIRNIYGVSKIYDTYVGTMNFEPENDINLQKIGEHGKEYGSTTGRKRQCNYLNLENLIDALFINQSNKCIINKTDILEHVGVYKLYHGQKLVQFETIEKMKNYIVNNLPLVAVTFSGSPYNI